MNRLLIVFIVIMFFVSCNTSVHEISDEWNFTLIKKFENAENTNLPIEDNSTMVIIYYPEICGYCLSQMNFLMKNISKIKPENKEKNIKLLCIIGTNDIITMQYYLDEKMEYVNNIYIDNKKNIANNLFSNNKMEYSAYFVIKNKKIIKRESLYDIKNINFLFKK